MTFLIELETDNPNMRCAYVGRHPIDWRVTERSEARTWKNRGWAVRWLAERPDVKGVVVECQ